MTVLAILGPTASGKSSVAMEVARRRAASGERIAIVAIDAFTVYRGMDLGTAKPTSEDRRLIEHHLIDVLDPSEELSVAAFQRLARDRIDGLHRQGVTPLLVGGSGLYWRAVVDDLRFPPTDAGVRAALEARWRGDPVGAHAALATRDEAAAEAIAPENARRVIRALEVIELTGERFSSFREAWDHHETVLPGLEVAYLEPPGDELRARIGERAEQMVRSGLLEEARQLRARGPLSRTAAQAIGYAEAFAVLDGRAEEGSLATAVATRTWRYARRQRTWFRADPRCGVHTADEVVARWT